MLEGIFVFYLFELWALMCFKVFVDIDFDVCFIC